MKYIFYLLEQQITFPLNQSQDASFIDQLGAKRISLATIQPTCHPLHTPWPRNTHQLAPQQRSACCYLSLFLCIGQLSPQQKTPTPFRHQSDIPPPPSLAFNHNEENIVFSSRLTFGHILRTQNFLFSRARSDWKITKRNRFRGHHQFSSAPRMTR